MQSHIVEAEYELSEMGILVGSYEPKAALASRESVTKRMLKLRHWRKHQRAHHAPAVPKVHASESGGKVIGA